MSCTHLILNWFGDYQSLRFCATALVVALFNLWGKKMKIAIIGSRGLHVENLEIYLPDGVTEIVSGGARGIDTDAACFAREKSLKMTVFLPKYDRYGRGAPILRNYQIVDYADEVLAFWDGRSRGTKSVIDYCQKQNKRVTVITVT